MTEEPMKDIELTTSATCTKCGHVGLVKIPEAEIPTALLRQEKAIAGLTKRYQEVCATNNQHVMDLIECVKRNEQVTAQRNDELTEHIETKKKLVEARKERDIANAVLTQAEQALKEKEAENLRLREALEKIVK